MKLVRLDGIFDITYGSQLDLNKMNIDLIGGVNFVSRSREKLGVCTKILNIDQAPFPRGAITVTLGGTYLLSSFVQQEPFYTAQNIKVLIPKNEMADLEKKFYCYVIESNRFRYTSHGREANKTLDSLMVPAVESLPEWVNAVKIPDVEKKPLTNKLYDLNISKWKDFNLSDLFDIQGTQSFTKQQIQQYGIGRCPYVVTSSENNGVQGFYNHFTEEGNVITIDSATIGSSFYQVDNFSASDHVEKLIPKFDMNKYHALFITTVLNLEKIRYGYGRKFAQMRIKKTKIKLPKTLEGGPDWEFMENYIKSLSYSSAL